METSDLHWPAGYGPADSPIHVINRLDLDRPPAVVWSKLITAPNWPQWYGNCADVRVKDGRGELSEGAEFTWRTFGMRLDSVVREFVPCERISWLAVAPGVRAYHAWHIVPAQVGCRVFSEETQHGVVARVGRLIFRNHMEMWHQRWLEGLAT